MAQTAKQRNIRQTHQEREIIKTSPDLIVYLDGLPYIINEFLGENDQGDIINFNDYVTAVNGSCDVETFIPGATITLSVPNAHRRFFFAPGGNRIISTMMDVRIFAKGYYPNPEGKTVYHRIFWGVVSAITYDDMGTTLEISISCKGVMRLMELMQINTAPGLIQYGDPEDVSPMRTKFISSNAFMSAFYMFVEPIQMSALKTTSVKEIGGSSGFGGDTTDERNAFYLGYAPKWSIYLRRLLKGLRFYPFRDEHKKDVFQKWTELAKNHENMRADNYTTSVHVSVKDSKFLEDTFAEFKELVNWAPDYAIGNITLFNSEIISRLERLRQMVDLIGYEGFQDLDGRIIIKPPLYNLDVTQWVSGDDKAEAPVNPFIVNLAEIEQESEQEDESAIRFTRTSVKGTMGQNPLMQGVGEELLATSSWIDLNLLRKFGLRAEEPKSYSFLGEDPETNFAWAVNEMTKSNRGYRSYQCTIPMRPELKLGYPIFLPHMDMYGYLRNISWSYNVGGTATMRLHLDCIRERVLKQDVEAIKVMGEDGKETTKNALVYKSVPNLVFEFTTAKTGTSEPKKDTSTSTGENDSAVAHNIRPSEKLPAEVKSEIERLGAAGFKKSMLPNPTTLNKAWRIQNGGISDKQATTKGGSSKSRSYVDFSKQNPVDGDYYYTLRTTIPYTDGKGYVVMAPFPWGRYMGLREALELFSMSSTEREAQRALRKKQADAKTTDTDSNEGKKQEKLNAFLFTALGTPSFDKQGGKAWEAIYNGLAGVQIAVLGDDQDNSKADDDQTWFVMEFDAQGKDLTVANMASPAAKEAADQRTRDGAAAGSSTQDEKAKANQFALVDAPKGIAGGKP
jgi:hypothetical protein